MAAALPVKGIREPVFRLRDPVPVMACIIRAPSHREAAMKAVVNEDMCEGHGKCQLAAPEVFVLGDDDISKVKLDPIPEELYEKVRRAARLCPRQAITVSEPATVGES